ncbi:hypothetical protein DMI69_24950 [Escherichia coli]|nr:hypothetical protein [Escherichia coli]
MRGKTHWVIVLLIVRLVAAGYCWRKKAHKTCRFAFCLPATSMSKPLRNIRELSTFQTRKGYVRNADCHIPKSGMDYLFAKLKASKDIYHEFVSGKIDSDDKFEARRKWPKQYGRN